MKYSIKLSLAFLTGALFLQSCGTGTGARADSIKIKEPSKIRADFDGYTINDVARYLAGRTENLPASFQKHVADPRYRRVKGQLDHAWAAYERNHLTPMSAWRSRLDGRVTEDIFYPFGGPDATHPVTLFPEAKRYTLFGLESFGRVPDPLKVSPAVAGAQVASIHQAMRFVLGVNFFRTNSMKVQVGSKPYNGIVSILLLFLGRMDMEVIDAYTVALSASGEIVPAENGLRATGVRVLFRRPGGGALREMNFIQANIANGGIASNPALRAYMNQRRDVTTMLKAASYLLHNASFSTIRGVILNRSRLILSDPSGMPFRFTNKPEWKMTAYGSYLRPIPLFIRRYEADRRRYFARTKTEGLPFKYGYHPTIFSIIIAERAK